MRSRLRSIPQESVTHPTGLIILDVNYDRSTGDLYYNPNSAFSGFGGGGKFATLEGAPNITESDFVLQ